MKLRPNGKSYPPSHILSEGGNPLTKYVNLCQTPEERRDKYAFSRFMGADSYTAMTLRDWHWPKINMYLEAFYRTKQFPMILTAPCRELSAAE